MADFPRLKPTRRSFELGEYPVKTYRSLSGKIIRRSFGNRPFGATIELSFENVSETVFDQIYTHYHTQQGTTIGFQLPNEILAGLNASGNLAGQLREGEPFAVLQSLGRGNGTANTMEWFYAEVPSVESVYRGLSTIKVRLVAEFR